MVEILNFKKGETVVKLNAAVTKLDVWGILMSTLEEHGQHIPFNWLI
jgi:hypothetical protein